MPRRKPFKSKRQARYLFAKKPALAHRFVREARAAGVKHPIKGLPGRVKRSKRSKRRRRR